MRRCKTERAKTTKLFPRQYWWAVPTLLITLLLASQARAAVIERDWKTPGDGLLTFDTVNQREWLDLSETLLSDFGSSYDNVVAETLPGGMFQGFRLAKSNDVIALAQSAGINTLSTDFAQNEIATESLVNLLGETAVFGAGGRTAAGVIGEFTSPEENIENQLVVDIRFSPAGNEAGVVSFPFSSITVDRPSRVVGTFIYLQVPEPCTIVFFAMYLPIYLNRFRCRQFNIDRC